MAAAPSPNERLALDVPFVDLEPVTSSVGEAVLSDFAQVMKEGAFVNGRAVRLFEDEFASWVGRSHCVGVASGLDALRFGLLAHDVGPGDEVIVPALTFVATFEAVAQVGATPVPVDVRIDDCGIDPEAAAAAVTARTRAIVPVHLYGQMCDARALDATAGTHDLVVVEDACQAHGATRDGLRAGGWGQAAAFSFYPSKNLGAMGDAGALVTDDESVAHRTRALREHGETSRYRSEHIGYTARLDTLQAVILSHKLPLVDGWNDLRRNAAATYDAELSGIGDLRLPESVSGSVHVWHLYTVRTADPEGLAKHLRTRGVATGRHYPEPPHRSLAFEHLDLPAGTFPVAEAIAAETISLPLYPGITPTQMALVVNAIKEYFRRD